MNYVCGFAFGEEYSRVALVLKNRPDFLKGKYNGIGGKIDDGENPEKAMVREFQEETGCITTLDDWNYFGELSFSGGVVRFYNALLDSDSFNSIRTVEDEEIQIVSVDAALYQLPLDIHARDFLMFAMRDDIEFIELTVK